MEKINIADLLRDCPQDMELDCTVFENLTFEEIDEVNSRILCNIQGNNGKLCISFNKFGCYSELNQAKCVIFPKGKTTWEGFQRPFKDGDIVFYDNCVSIFKEWGDETLFRNYVKVDIDGRHPMLCDRTYSCGKGIKREARFATEEQKEKLFNAIKDNGYRWNPETKQLEKLPKFKVGDKIRNKKRKEEIRTIKSCENIVYWVSENSWISIDDQDKWELAPNKFDINTLVPFESRVLVRSGDSLSEWKPAIFGIYRNRYNNFYVVGGTCWKCCIPYEGNEHLLGTTNDCEDYFKTWQK